MKGRKIDPLERKLELLVDDTAFGLGEETQDSVENYSPASSECHRNELMTIADLAQFCFLRLEPGAYQEMPDRVRTRILRAADDFFARQNNNANHADD